MYSSLFLFFGTVAYFSEHKALEDGKQEGDGRLRNQANVGFLVFYVTQMSYGPLREPKNS